MATSILNCVTEDDTWEVKCPICGQVNSHIREVFLRKGTSTEDKPYKGVVIKGKTNENRHALVIIFDGECGHGWKWVIQQHKGTDFVTWDEVPWENDSPEEDDDDDEEEDAEELKLELRLVYCCACRYWETNLKKRKRDVGGKLYGCCRIGPPVIRATDTSDTPLGFWPMTEENDCCGKGRPAP
jgi:hypothetical protein